MQHTKNAKCVERVAAWPCRIRNVLWHEWQVGLAPPLPMFMANNSDKIIRNLTFWITIYFELHLLWIICGAGCDGVTINGWIMGWIIGWIIGWSIGWMGAVAIGIIIGWIMCCAWYGCGIGKFIWFAGTVEHFIASSYEGALASAYILDSIFTNLFQNFTNL